MLEVPKQVVCLTQAIPKHSQNGVGCCREQDYTLCHEMSEFGAEKDLETSWSIVKYGLYELTSISVCLPATWRVMCKMIRGILYMSCIGHISHTEVFVVPVSGIHSTHTLYIHVVVILYETLPRRLDEISLIHCMLTDRFVSVT